MQVEIDMKHMQTKFGGHGISGFGDFAYFSFTFKMAKISLRVHGGQKIESAQKSHKSRG